MSSRLLAASGSAIAIAATAGGALVVPEPAFGQTVADRTLSDIKVENVGGCTTLTVNFNIRIQMLSHFPDNGGRELHVRVRPLDASSASLLRESLRTPASVPELRSIEYEGDNPSGPVLSLFFTHDMRFEVEPGAQPQVLVIKLAEPGSGPLCPITTPAETAVQQPVEAAPGKPAAPPPGVAIPAGLYAVNVLSKPGNLGEFSAGQKSATVGLVTYETLFERDSQTWHRLRLGFFETREEAEAARTKLAAQFPDAWVVKVSADERAQGVANRIDKAAPVAVPATAAGGTATEADVAATARLIGEAEAAIRDSNNDRAVQLLTNATALPENPNTPRAIELLGLTRERKGQKAHAQAEYEEYLRRYPTGEGAERVRQRLGALTLPSAGGTAQQELRQASGDSGGASKWTWGARGSFSQFYFRDQSTIKTPDAANVGVNTEVDNSVNLNQLLTAADVTFSGGNDRRQIQLRAAGSYTQNFGTSSTVISNGNSTFTSRPGEGIKSLTALYLDYSDSDLGGSLRFGRQTRNSAGVLGRFDGLLVGFQPKPKVKVNLVGGFPVLTSRQTWVLKDRWFYGASVDVGGRQSPLQTTVYWFDQHARGGFVDRRSIGLEARYLRPRFNAFTIIDYDVKYRKFNLSLLSMNYTFPDNSSFSLTADYRQSPLLTTSNALIGQIDPNTLLPITDLPGLRPFFTDPEIYQLARDRTLQAKSLTVSYSRPISKKLQANLDMTVTNTGGTPASGGVAALPATGREYYYGAQLVGSDLLFGNDIYILSGRYSDTQRSRTYTADFNARVPITSKFRISPRMRYGYRSDKFIDSSFSQLQPTMRLNYYPMRHSEVEVEVGGNFTRQTSVIGGSTNRTNESGFVVSAGYRLDF